MSPRLHPAVPWRAGNMHLNVVPSPTVQARTYSGGAPAAAWRPLRRPCARNARGEAGASSRMPRIRSHVTHRRTNAVTQQRKGTARHTRSSVKWSARKKKKKKKKKNTGGKPVT
eukprot:NODE_17764_length_926_cov_19.123905.p2 GENE.NODE_17764_length_926_cov_19.123905~~NODE_17764_length_926_cov_19.123905.p2  ORF type:complete len:114 (-),score=26.86 NODE_17764_length_926_cov_19.123905:147-488(-)